MKRLLLICFLSLPLLAFAPAQAAEFSSALNFQLEKANAQDFVSAIVILPSTIDIRRLDERLHIERATRVKRHKEVVDALKFNAAQNQPQFVQEFEEVKAAGRLQSYKAFWIENLFVIYATKEYLESLRQRGDILYVTENFRTEIMEPVRDYHSQNRGDSRPIRLDDELVTPGQQAIGATRVNRELGITGEGVLVANLDTGVDGNHPALASRWRGANNAHPWQECWRDALGGNSQFPQPAGDHGTHVMGTICGRAINGNDTITVGGAPDALWIADNAIGGFDNTFTNDVIDAYEWFIDPDENPNTVDDVPDVIQNSWRVNEGFGGYLDCDDRWNTVVLNCEAGGTVITWSAGNEGPTAQSMGTPPNFSMNATQIFSVGACDATNDNTPPYAIADFSSRGPTTCDPAVPNDIKPEICAPGVDVYSSVPGGQYAGPGWSGTSMAGPHVAGVVALMRQACPDCDPQTIKEALLATAIDVGYGPAGEDNTYGAGFLNAYDAVLAVANLGRIDGIVTSSGSPLSDVRVQAIGLNRSTMTNASGYYNISAEEGTYTVRYEKFGYNTVVMENIQTTEGDTTHVNVTMNTAPQGTLHGTVQVQSGIAIPNAQVVILNTPIDTITTNGNGEFTQVLPATNYQVRVMITFQLAVPTQFTLDTTVTINAGGTTNVLFTVTVPQVDPTGPDAYGYMAFDRYDRDHPAPYDWIELNPDFGGPGSFFQIARLRPLQDSSGYLDTPFPLKFYGQTYDSITVNNDGWIAPGIQTSTAPNNSQIPNPIGPSGMIAPLWDNFQVGLSATQFQWYDFVNGRWVLEFLDQQLLPPRAFPLSAWEVHIFDQQLHPTRTGDSPILFVYQSVPFNGFCTVGIENQAENTGLEIIYDGTPGANSFPINGDAAVYFTTGEPIQFGTASGTVTLNPPSNDITQATVRIGNASGSVAANGTVTVANAPAGTVAAVLNFDGYELRQDRDLVITNGGSVNFAISAWRLDPPSAIFASQHNGLVTLAWSAPEYLSQYPYDSPISYTVLRNNSDVIARNITNTQITDPQPQPDESIVSYQIITNYRYGSSLPANHSIEIDLAAGETQNSIPTEFALEQNYPNPFNPSTDIRFAVPELSKGMLQIFDINGRLVRTLAEGQFTPGYHSYQWNSRDNHGKTVSTGVYLYRFTTERFSQTRKMLLVK